jgi:hypothetical protein
MTEKIKAAKLNTRAASQKTSHTEYLTLDESQTDAGVQIAIKIQRILDAHPDLLKHGWRTPCDPITPLEITPKIIREVETGIAYLALHQIPKTLSSYALKHHIEKWGEKNNLAPYLYNTSAIIAALLSGYEPVMPKGAPCLNCLFRKARK